MWLLSKLLMPVLKYVPAHLSDSLQLINRIKDIPATEHENYNYPVSLDVEALYTSVPPQPAIQYATNMIEKHKTPTYSLTSEDIKTLLQCIVNNIYFTFEGILYKQTNGLPMGARQPVYQDP